MMSNRTSLTKTEKQPFFHRLGSSLGTLEIVIRLPTSIQCRARRSYRSGTWLYRWTIVMSSSWDDRSVELRLSVSGSGATGSLSFGGAGAQGFTFWTTSP